jgi:hypothetical protein
MSAPVISNITPTPGTSLAATAPVGFQATQSASSFVIATVWASYPVLGIYEVIHDGVQFSANYNGSRTVISGGYQYSGIVRVGGWPASPTLVPVFVDNTGAVNA